MTDGKMVVKLIFVAIYLRLISTTIALTPRFFHCW